MDSKVQEKLQNFFGKFEQKKFKKGELLVKPHKELERVFFLVKGTVRMYSVSKKGVEITLNVFKPFSIFPLGPIINDKENLYFYDALNDVTAFSAPKKEVLSFFQKEHEVTFDLLARIYKGLDGYFLRMESLLGGDAYHKVVTQLVIQERRFGKVELTHSKLASLTGLSRETVTREINKLQKKSVVAYKGWKLKIRSAEKLERELL
jgi:CRP/FNR family transcriptional regulator